MDATGSESSPIRFDGQVAVVTGAGRGIGREFARLLAARGAAVLVNDIGASVDDARYLAEDRRGLVAHDVAAEIVAAGGRAVANSDDVANPNGASFIVEQAVGELGGLDIIINNAGVIITGSLEELTLADLQRSLGVHVGGAFNVSRAAWPRLRAQRSGRILNVCSVEGVVFGNPTMSLYDTAKGAMAGLTRALAAEGREHEIMVNGLLPGAATRGQRSVRASMIPSTEIDMSPSLVAPAACWLVSHECTATGRFYAASSGRMGLVYTAMAEGYQSARPGDFGLEQAREHWDEIQSEQPAMTPDGVGDFNAWRLDVYRRRTSGATR